MEEALSSIEPATSGETSENSFTETLQAKSQDGKSIVNLGECSPFDLLVLVLGYDFHIEPRSK